MVYLKNFEMMVENYFTDVDFMEVERKKIKHTLQFA